jgi:hypothetical protein
MGLEQRFILTTITLHSEILVSASSTSSIPGWRLKDLQDLLLDAPIFSSPYTLPLKERVEDGTRIQKQEIIRRVEQEGKQGRRTTSENVRTRSVLKPQCRKERGKASPGRIRRREK